MKVAETQRVMRNKRLGAIHALRRSTNICDETYGDIVERYAGNGVRSCGKIHNLQTLRRIEQHLAGITQKPTRYTSPPMRKARVLWGLLLRAGHIGDNNESAFHAYVARQTGKVHPRFVSDHECSVQLIEPLKHWCDRLGVKRD